MILEKYKRIILDIIASATSWILFFAYRKLVIEESFLELSATLLYGTIGVTLFWTTIYSLSGTYKDVRRVSRLNELYRTLTQTIAGSFCIFFFLIIDDIENYKNYQLYYEALAILMFLHFSITFLIRYTITNSMVKKIQNRKIQFKTILIGDSQSIINTFNTLNNMPRSMGNHLIGYINFDNFKDIAEIKISNLGHINNLQKQTKKHKIEEAILAFDKHKHRDITMIIHSLIHDNIITKITPNLVDFFSGKLKTQSLFNPSLIEIPQIKMPVYQAFIKRLIDISVSMLALIILFPLLIVISIAVKLSSPGPIFYYQERIGYQKKHFNIIKFRSMFINAEDGIPLLSSSHDNRITNWGKIMRKYRLDELPQFYNVLVGEMSLVGPRPERDFFATKILKKAPQYNLIYKVKPGITSWGMVKFGYAENVDEMIARLRYDIIYLYNLSLFYDLQVLIWTIFIVLQGRGK